MIYDGEGGGDNLTVNGTAMDDAANVNPTNGGSGSFASRASPSFSFTGATIITVNGGLGGFDVIEVQGTDAADVVNVTGAVITLVGTVNIGAGIDELNILTFGGTDDVAAGVRVPTTVELGSGNDLVPLGTGAGIRLTLLGGTGDDALFGGAGADRLEGGEGDDTMVGGGGDDFAYGGAGSDTFV